MTCDDLREDLEAFALGALEPEQARRVTAHVRDCGACSQIVRAYQVAVEHLALSVPLYRASPRLRERILGGIGAFRPPVYASFLRQRVWATAAAVVLVAFAVGAIAWAVVLSSQVNRLREDNRHLAELTQLDAEQRAAILQFQTQLSSAQSAQREMSTTLEEQATLIEIALDPDLIPSKMQGTQVAPQATCSYVWSTQQGLGALTCKNLPSTGFMLTYELWATKGDKTLAVGTFLPRDDGTASLLVKFPTDAEGPVSNLWVTLEQQTSGTRARPSNEVVLFRSPDQQAQR
ncbi:MAG TPA: anti-sigma factor [Dehalococcoidia bacterium]